MFSDFKPVLKILLRFIGIYVALLLAYQLYLNSQAGDLDVFSKTVGRQSVFVLNSCGYKSAFYDQPSYETGWFYVRQRWVSRMVEGCNAVSVMILFVAFVFAFYKGAPTFIFTALGLVFLHIANILRIAGLNVLIIKKPELSHAGHEYFFPAVIYGSVVALWLVWIKFFALKTYENS